jgi:hypothetical protein
VQIGGRRPIQARPAAARPSANKTVHPLEIDGGATQALVGSGRRRARTFPTASHNPLPPVIVSRFAVAHSTRWAVARRAGRNFLHVRCRRVGRRLCHDHMSQTGRSLRSMAERQRSRPGVRHSHHADQSAKTDGRLTCSAGFDMIS